MHNQRNIPNSFANPAFEVPPVHAFETKQEENSIHKVKFFTNKYRKENLVGTLYNCYKPHYIYESVQKSVK